MKKLIKLFDLRGGVQLCIIRNIGGDKKYIINVIAPPPPKMRNKLPPALLHVMAFDSEKDRDTVFDGFNESSAMEFLIQQEKNISEKSLYVPEKFTA